MQREEVSQELYNVLYAIMHNIDNLCDLSKKPLEKKKVERFARGLEPGISEEDIAILQDLLNYGKGKSEDLCEAYYCLKNECKCDPPARERVKRLPRPVWRL